MNEAFQRGPSDLMVKSSSKQGGKICGRSGKRPAGCYLINKDGTYMQKYISTYGHNQSRAITSAEAYKNKRSMMWMCSHHSALQTRCVSKCFQY